MVTIHAGADDVDADDHADDGHDVDADADDVDADDHTDADDDVNAHGDTDDVINDGDITTADDGAGNFDGAFAFW